MTDIIDKALAGTERASTQPAPSIPSHTIAQTVNELRDIAIQFHATGQLRERIAHVIVPLLKGVATQPAGGGGQGRPVRV